MRSMRKENLSIIITTLKISFPVQELLQLTFYIPIKADNNIYLKFCFKEFSFTSTTWLRIWS